MTMKARQNWICLENYKSKCHTCGERPSHRTTDKRDELAPLHLAVPSALGPRLPQSLEPSTLPAGLRVGNATRSPSETDMARCRSWVIRVVLTFCPSLPICPYQRTSLGRPDWSVSCQYATSLGRYLAEFPRASRSCRHTKTHRRGLST